MYILQNLERIGLSNLFLSSTTIKKRVEILNFSIHLLKADCASIVNLSALNKTIDLNLNKLLLIFVFAKYFQNL